MKLKMVFGGAYILWAANAFAQDVASETAVEISRKGATPDGYYYTLNLTAGGSVGRSQNVVGQPDGVTTTYNLKLDYKSVLVRGSSEWENNLAITETITRTPVIPRSVKSGDELKLVSFYKNYLESISWLGYFARVSLDAPLLATYDERPETVRYVDKTNGQELATADRLKLADGFKPMTIKESAGAIARVYNTDAAKVEMRTGPASKQYLGGGQRVIDDDETTPPIEVRDLAYVRTTGLEVAVEVSGKLMQKKLEYTLYGEALYPIEYAPESDTDPEKSKLVSTEAGLSLAYNMTDWLALSYTGKSKRDPLVQAEAEINQTYLVTATFKTSNEPETK